jgi:hypothetical protein
MFFWWGGLGVRNPKELGNTTDPGKLLIVLSVMGAFGE